MRNNRFTATVVGTLVLSGTAAVSSAQRPNGSLTPLYTRIAAVAPGSIHGLVRDDSGSPVAGATVSALGGMSVFATTDRNGRYDMRAVSPGTYVVRAHQTGYNASRSQVVEVRSSTRVPNYIWLRRANATKVAAAGVGVPAGASPAATPVENAPASATVAPGSDDSELAWRLRHPERRSILKDSVVTDLFGGDDATQQYFAARGFGSPSDAALRFAAYADNTWSGEVNFLTSGSFDTPQQLFSAQGVSHGIAYLSLNAPLGQADWTVRGAVTRADISSWVLAGSYRERQTEGHQYNLGMSYSTQRYDGGNPLALRDLTNGSRNVGELYGFDTVSLTPTVSVNYGARYAHYDYLLWRNLISPRVEVTVSTAEHVRVKALMSRRALAPGAEEFLPPQDSFVWLPPQRTFSALEPGHPLAAEYTTHGAVTLERDMGRSTVGVRAFHQRVDQQLVTLFGTALPGEPVAEVGHYQVGSGGDARATGAAVSVDRIFSRWLRGRVEYSAASAVLMPDENLRYIMLMSTPEGFKGAPERIHDLATTVEADIPETSTRVFFLYRLSNGFTQVTDRPGLGISTRAVIDSRFDVQFRQALPFMNFSSTKWEMLFGVRNMFREPVAEQSVYDELLVVRPPKRLVGGITMLF